MGSRVQSECLRERALRLGMRSLGGVRLGLTVEVGLITPSLVGVSTKNLGPNYLSTLDIKGL